jgi:Uma2 family endonuclease
VQSSDQPREKTVSEAAVVLDDMTRTDLRQLADRLLEATRVEYVDDGVLLVMNPPALEHRTIVRLIVEAILVAVATRATSVRWAVDSENFQWELPDQSDRFYVPDVVVSYPGAATPVQERAAIVLITEVTSPASADTVYNDRVVKPAQYAKAGVPLYLLVDQERAAWTLFGLGDKPGYQVLAAGKFGESVPLPAPLGFSIPTTEWPSAT